MLTSPARFYGRRIAEEAGCTTGRITHYFADKEEVKMNQLPVGLQDE